MSFRRRATALVLSAAVSFPILSVAGAAAVRAFVPCSDVQVIYARGSGRPVGGDDFLAFNGDPLNPTNGILARVDRSAVNITTYQLGQDDGNGLHGYGGFYYQALGDITQLAQSVWPFLPGSAYDNSVNQGVGELRT
jgi:hypothetical protein